VKRKIEVVPLDEREMERFYKMSIPAVGYAGRVGIKTVAAGGIVRGEDGRHWGFIDFLPSGRTPLIYRYVLRFLSDMREDGVREIYVTRDSTFSTSEAFLTRAGFNKTEEIYEDKEVWVWRA
jgi:hypothetical protein